MYGGGMSVPLGLAPAGDPASAPGGCDPAPSAECCSLSDGVVEAASAERMSGVLKALSDPTRLQLLSYVTAAGCVSVALGDAAERLGISRPTVSHHMKRLVDAGLLVREQHGKQARYTAVPEAFAELRTLLDIS